MPIEFACPSCQRQYRVKDELAGKNAKCGKCGHRMPIPQATAAPAAAKPAAPKVASASPAQAKRTVSSTTTLSATPPTSWLDEDLEQTQPAAQPKAAQRAPACPACGAALTSGAVLCVSCGYDTRTGEKHETHHVLEPATPPRKKKSRASGFATTASLLRGTIFSFIAALLGAAIWAVLVYFTMRQFIIVAWALGGLTGLGMALGHDDEDGTIAGIIAAFMSLLGIVAAKILIIVIFVGAAVATMVNNIELADDASPLEIQREVAALAIAAEKLDRDGAGGLEANEQQWEQAMDAARAEVAELNEEQLQERMAQIEKRENAAAEAEDLEPDAAHDVPDAAFAEDDPAAPALANEEQPGIISLFFSEMFSPVDGIFILFAFFTAYKVGSGQMSD